MASQDRLAGKVTAVEECSKNQEIPEKRGKGEPIPIFREEEVRNEAPGTWL